MEGRPPASLVFVQLLWYSCSRSAESVTSCLKKNAKSFARGFADTIGKSMRNLMPGECESFCQRSVNFRNACSIGSHRQSIPSERRSCDTLPSKQAVTNVSPSSPSIPLQLLQIKHFRLIPQDMLEIHLQIWEKYELLR